MKLINSIAVSVASEDAGAVNFPLHSTTMIAASEIFREILRQKRFYMPDKRDHLLIQLVAQENSKAFEQRRDQFICYEEPTWQMLYVTSLERDPVCAFNAKEQFNFVIGFMADVLRKLCIAFDLEQTDIATAAENIAKTQGIDFEIDTKCTASNTDYKATVFYRIRDPQQLLPLTKENAHLEQKPGQLLKRIEIWLRIHNKRKKASKNVFLMATFTSKFVRRLFERITIQDGLIHFFPDQTWVIIGSFAEYEHEYPKPVELAEPI